MDSYQVVSEHSILGAQMETSHEKSEAERVEQRLEGMIAQLKEIEQFWKRRTKREGRRSRRDHAPCRRRSEKVSEKDFEVYLDTRLQWLQQFYVTPQSTATKKETEKEPEAELNGAGQEPPPEPPEPPDSDSLPVPLYDTDDEDTKSRIDLGLMGDEAKVTNEGVGTAELQRVLDLGVKSDRDLGFTLSVETMKGGGVTEKEGGVTAMGGAVSVAEMIPFARDLGRHSLSLVTDGSDMFGRKGKVRADWISGELGFWIETMGQAQYLLITPPKLTNTRGLLQEKKEMDQESLVGTERNPKEVNSGSYIMGQVQVQVSESDDPFDIKRGVSTAITEKNKKLIGFGWFQKKVDFTSNPMGQTHNFIITPPIFTNTGRVLQVASGLENKRDHPSAMLTGTFPKLLGPQSINLSLYLHELPIAKQVVVIQIDSLETITTLGRNNSGFAKYEWHKLVAEQFIQMVESPLVYMWDPGGIKQDKHGPGIILLEKKGVFSGVIASGGYLENGCDQRFQLASQLPLNVFFDNTFFHGNSSSSKITRRASAGNESGDFGSSNVDAMKFTPTPRLQQVFFNFQSNIVDNYGGASMSFMVSKNYGTKTQLYNTRKSWHEKSSNGFTHSSSNRSVKLEDESNTLSIRVMLQELFNTFLPPYKFIELFITAVGKELSQDVLSTLIDIIPLKRYDISTDSTEFIALVHGILVIGGAIFMAHIKFHVEEDITPLDSACDHKKLVESQACNHINLWEYNEFKISRESIELLEEEEGLSGGAKSEWHKIMVELLVQQVESSRKAMTDTHYKQWDPGKTYSTSCIIAASCFKLLGFRRKTTTVYLRNLHLEDKLNFKGGGIDTNKVNEGYIGNIQKVNAWKKWEPMIWGPQCKHSIDCNNLPTWQVREGRIFRLLW